MMSNNSPNTDGNGQQGRNPKAKPAHKPNRRREGREAALQLLYSYEQLPDLAEKQEELDAFWEMRNAESDKHGVVTREIVTDLADNG